MKNLRDGQELGTVLGISKYSGECSTVPDKDVNQVVMVLGTTGSGKTITLRRFYQRAITQGYPLIVVDGKPDVDNIAWLMKLAEQHGRRFFGFNCGSTGTITNGISNVKDFYFLFFFLNFLILFCFPHFSVCIFGCSVYDKAGYIKRETRNNYFDNS